MPTNNEYDELLGGGPAVSGGYDAVVQDQHAETKSKLQESFAIGTQAQPDTRAKALQLGAQTGLPAPVVERNLPKVEQQAARPNEYDALLNNNPRLADWLAASPDNVAVAQDDLDNLGSHEKAISEHGWTRTLWNSVNSMSTHLGSTLTRLPAAAVNVLNAGTYGVYNALVPESMEVDPRRYTFKTDNPVSRYYDNQTKLWNIPAMEADMVDAFGMIGRGEINSAAKVATSQLISSVLPSMLVAGAATAAGQPALGLTAMGAMSGADAYQQAEQAGVTPGQAASHAVTSGSLEVLTESLSFGTMGWMKNVVESVGKRFGKQAGVQFAKETALEITKAMGGEAAEELAAEAGQAASEYLNGVNPQAFDDFGRRMFNAGVLGALGGGAGATATSVGVGTAKLVEHAQQRAQAKADKALYLELGKLAEGSKVRARGNDLHQQALLALAGDSQVKDVYVPVEAFEQAPWQDATAADMAQRLGVAEAYNLAKETGDPAAEVKVPLAAWVNSVVGTPAYAALAQDIKFDPQGMTLNQVAVQEAELKAKMEAEAQAAAAQPEEGAQPESAQADAIQTAKADFKAQVLAQRESQPWISDQYAENLAELYARGLDTMAKDAGVDPMEIHRRFQIGKATEAGVSIGQDQIQPGETPTQYLARRYENLSPEQRLTEFMRDRKTGMLGERATQLGEGHHLARVEFSGGKYANDEMGGHEAGDDAFRAQAAAVYAVDPLAVKQGGGFAIHAVDQADLDAKLEAIRAALPDAVQVGGESVSGKGFEVIGSLDPRDIETAKEAAVKAGTYADRGARPKGLVPAEGGQRAERLAAEIPAEWASRFAALSPEAAQRMNYLDKGSPQVDPDGNEYRIQMLNDDGYHATPEMNFNSSADLHHMGLSNRDSLLGRKAGDAILTAATDAMLKAANRPEFAGRVVIGHISGDEFAAKANDPRVLEAYWLAVEDSLQNPVEITATDGKIWRKDNVTLSVGLGVNDGQAEQAQLDSKKRLKEWRETHGWYLVEPGAKPGVARGGQGDVRGSGVEWHPGVSEGARRGAGQAAGRVPGQAGDGVSQGTLKQGVSGPNGFTIGPGGWEVTKAQTRAYYDNLKRTGDENAARDAAHKAGLRAGLSALDAERGVTAAMHNYDDVLNMVPRDKVQLALNQAGRAEQTAPVWYSKLKQTIEQKMPAKASVEQVRGLTKEISADEKKWLGLDELLKDKQTVTKAELLGFLAGNDLGIQEVVKGGDAGKFQAAVDRMQADGFTIESDDYFGVQILRDGEEVDPADLTERQQADLEVLKEGQDADSPMENGSTKFSQYQLPGGKNYREVLFTLPEKVKPADPRIEEIFKIPFWDRTPEQNKILSDNTKPKADVFHSSHWDERNVLAHVRLNDRVDADGKRVLFVEEIQSDWHQKGRKEGYKGEKKAPDIEVTKEGNYWNYNRPDIGPGRNLHGNIVAWKGSGWEESRRPFPNGGKGYRANFQNTDAEFDTYEGADAWLREVMGKTLARVDHEPQSVPDAPFRKTWHEFAFKRILRMAAEGGYDRVAWTTGAQQVERYPNEMRKAVDKFTWSAESNGKKIIDLYKNGDSIGKVKVSLADGVVSDSVNVPQAKGKHLSELIGKEMAAKILGDPAEGEIQGKDFTVGGEGMKGFYDKILPDFANKFGKKFGAKVGETEVETQEAYPEDKKGFPAKHVTAHSIDVTPALRDAALTQGFSLFQNPSDGARGRITFLGQTLQVEMLEKADFTTLVHEVFGHGFLQVQAELAAAPNATDAIKKRQADTLEWLGLESTDQLMLAGKTPGSPEYERAKAAHEKFATGFEVYMQEGKAPTPALRKVFAAFRIWITNALRKLTSQGVNLSDQARRVYDRFFATEEEVKQAQAAQNQGPLFADPLAAGFTPAKAEAYTKALEDARQAAEEKVLAKLVRDMNREQTEAWQAERARVQAEVEAEVNQRPIYQAISILRDGKRLDGTAVEPIKLDAAQVPKGAKLPKGLTAKEGGLHPDVAASMLGFQSGSELLRQLAAVPKRESIIKQATDARMQELQPELLTSADLPEEAKAAVHNDKRAQVLRLELEHLAENNMPALKDAVRRVARRVPTEAAVRRQAEAIIGKRPVAELKPYLFERAERNAAKLAGEALAKGDFAAAFEAKQRELLNHELYRASVNAQELVDNSLDKFKKLAQPDEKLAKSRDMALVNAARAVLATFGIGKTDKPAGAYLEAMQKYELDEDVVETVNALVLSATQKAAPGADYRTIPYADFVAMADAVDALWSLAKSTRQIEIDGKMMDRQEVMAEMETRLGELTPAAKEGLQRAASKGDRVIRGLMGARAALRRVESWADAVDGGDPQGPFRRYVWNPVKEAVNRYRLAKRGILERYLDIVKQVEPTLTREEIPAPELGYAFTGKQELLGALLHTGNESNLSKLLRGRGWGAVDEAGNLDRRRWDAFVARMHNEGVLTKADWDYAQAVWDLLEDTKADAQRAHKRMYGHYFNEVTANEVATPFGTYRGGYMPAVADPFLAQDAAIRQEKEQLEKSNNSFMFPTAGRGFTKSRVDAYAAPLTLDLALVPAHLDKVMRFVHIEPAVKDVSRIVMDRGFRKSLDAFDPTVGGDMLVPWLQRAAQQRISQPSKGWAGRAADTFFRELRTRTGLQVMTANVLNALQQVTGLSMAAVKVKPRHLRNALWDYVRAPKDTAEAVTEKSEAMRSDLSASAFEIQQTIDDLLLNPSKYDKARDFAKKHGYFMQMGTQNMVNVITWTGAYNQAVEAGASEADAVREADAAVRQTQGTMNPEDVSRFETGTPFMRAFTMFYSYFNMQANLLGTEFTKVARDLGLRKGAGRGLYVYAMGFMAPALLAELIVRAGAGGLDEDDDDEYMDDVLAMFFGSQFRTATAMVPVVGPSVNAGINAFNDKWYDDRISTSPGVSMVESAVRAPKSVYDAIVEDKPAKRAIKDTLTALGLLTGLPLAPLGRPAGYLADVAEGEADPQGPLDMARGLVTGKSGQR